MIVDSVSNIGPHYARTLREWRRRFLDRFEDVIVPALGEEYPSVMGPNCGEQGRREIEVFKKKWICKVTVIPLGPLPDMLLPQTITIIVRLDLGQERLEVRSVEDTNRRVIIDNLNLMLL